MIENSGISCIECTLQFGENCHNNKIYQILVIFCPKNLVYVSIYLGFL